MKGIARTARRAGKPVETNLLILVHLRRLGGGESLKDVDETGYHPSVIGRSIVGHARLPKLSGLGPRMSRPAGEREPNPAATRTQKNSEGLGPIHSLLLSQMDYYLHTPSVRFLPLPNCYSCKYVRAEALSQLESVGSVLMENNIAERRFVRSLEILRGAMPAARATPQYGFCRPFRHVRGTLSNGGVASR
jgi:hypothetical protein